MRQRLFLPYAPLIASLALASLACGPPITHGTPNSSQGPSERGAKVSILSDGLTLSTKVVVIDDAGRSTRLDPSEFLYVDVKGETRGLVLEQTPDREWVYRSAQPPELEVVDIPIHLATGRAPGTVVAAVRLSSPFSITSAPSEVIWGEELRLAIDSARQAANGSVQIHLAGPCIAEMLPSSATTYGGFSEVGFNTSLLTMVSDACDVNVTVDVTNVGTVTKPFQLFLSDEVRSAQRRTVVVHLSRTR